MHFARTSLKKSVQKRRKNIKLLDSTSYQSEYTSFIWMVQVFSDFSKIQFGTFSRPAIGLVILFFVSKSLLSMFSFDDNRIIFLFKRKKKVLVKLWVNKFLIKKNKTYHSVSSLSTQKILFVLCKASSALVIIELVSTTTLFVLILFVKIIADSQMKTLYETMNELDAEKADWNKRSILRIVKNNRLNLYFGFLRICFSL